MDGIINKAITRCRSRGKEASVARRYLKMKHKIKIGELAFKKRVERINQTFRYYVRNT